MSVDAKDKFFWFVFLELLCGFASSVVYLHDGGLVVYYGKKGGDLKDLGDAMYDSIMEGIGDSRRRRNTERIEFLMVDTLISGAFLPLVFRFQVHTWKKRLGKGLFFALIISPLAFYVAGASILIVKSGDDIPQPAAAKAVFALIAGFVLFVDAICYFVDN